MIQRTTIDLAECTAFHRALASPRPWFARGALLSVAGLIGVALLWCHGTVATRVVKAPGRVRPLDAPHVPLDRVSGRHFTSAVAGRVAAVCFDWGGEIESGQVLVRLDTEDLLDDIRKLKVVVTDADAELVHQERLLEDLKRQGEVEGRLAKARIADAKETIALGKATQAAKVQMAQSELQARTVERDRLVGLRRTGRAVSAEDLDRSIAAAEVAAARLQEAQVPVPEARLEILQAEAEAAVVRNRSELHQIGRQLHERRGERDSRRRQLAEKELLLQRAVITAPCRGLVTSGRLQVGDRVEPGQVLATIVATTDTLRMDVLVPHHEIGRVRPGTPARIKLSAWDHQKYGTIPAEVSFVAPEAEGDGFLVSLTLSDHCLRGQDQEQVVKIGMTGTAEIIVDEDRLLILAVRWLREQAAVPIR
jgi:membrane fusion protein (multidrug efflux system)